MPILAGAVLCQSTILDVPKLSCNLQFRDEYSVFVNAGASVVGISSDSPEALVEFSHAQKLNFPLLSDQDAKLRKGLKVKGDSLETLQLVKHPQFVHKLLIMPTLYWDSDEQQLSACHLNQQ